MNNGGSEIKGFTNLEKQEGLERRPPPLPPSPPPRPCVEYQAAGFGFTGLTAGQLLRACEQGMACWKMCFRRVHPRWEKKDLAKSVRKPWPV